VKNFLRAVLYGSSISFFLIYFIASIVLFIAGICGANNGRWKVEYVHCLQKPSRGEALVPAYKLGCYLGGAKGLVYYWEGDQVKKKKAESELQISIEIHTDGSAIQVVFMDPDGKMIRPDALVQAMDEVLGVIAEEMKDIQKKRKAKKSK
jgi:hypothetical protein